MTIGKELVMYAIENRSNPSHYKLIEILRYLICGLQFSVYDLNENYDYNRIRINIYINKKITGIKFNTSKSLNMFDFYDIAHSNIEKIIAKFKQETLFEYFCDSWNYNDSNLESTDFKITKLDPKIESYSITQRIQNSSAWRDISQTINITNVFPKGDNSMNDQNTSNKNSKQVVESVNLTGGIKQNSDAANTHQTIKNATGKEVEQSIKTEKQNLSIGKYKASGKWAVIGLVAVLIIVAIFNWLSK